MTAWTYRYYEKAQRSAFCLQATEEDSFSVTR